MENQVEMMGYLTKNFEICDESVSLFNDLKSLLPKMSEESRIDTLKAMKYQDTLYAIEKSAYEVGSITDEDIDQAIMISHMITYNIGMVSAELDMDIIDRLSYLPMHLKQIMNPSTQINPMLPAKKVEEKNMYGKIVQQKEYEGRMARASLKKVIAYATEMLNMIDSEDELEAWVQDKISNMSHSIEAVYTYYRFNEEETEDENNNHEMEVEMEDMMEEEMPPLPPTMMLSSKENK